MRVSIMALVVAALAVTACQDGPTSPHALSVNISPADDRSTGDTPNYNLEAVLRGDGFGLVKFREPKNDDIAKRIYLDVWVRDLEPNTSYQLQRATDTTLDGSCTGTNWITLGQGAQPQSIVTDERGTGRAELFRDVPAFPIGSSFDIHFRVIVANTTNPAVVVLMSGCYQFTLR